MSSSEKVLPFLSIPVDQLLAITAYGEAGQEGGEGIMAVLNVIRNRTRSLSTFGDPEILSLTASSYHAVILKPLQFSMYNQGDPVRPTAERIASNFESEVASNVNLRMAYDLAVMLLNNQLSDNTGGADHYHATYVAPTWAASMPATTQIGQHIFYASIPRIPIIGDVIETVQAGFQSNPIIFLAIGVGLALALVKGIRR